VIIEVTPQFASKHVLGKLVTTTTRNGISSLTPCIPPARLERLRLTSVLRDNGEGGCTPGISFSASSRSRDKRELGESFCRQLQSNVRELLDRIRAHGKH
jgi:hypothetical protein